MFLIEGRLSRRAHRYPTGSPTRRRSTARCSVTLRHDERGAGPNLKFQALEHFVETAVEHDREEVPTPRPVSPKNAGAQPLVLCHLAQAHPPHDEAGRDGSIQRNQGGT